MKIAPNFPRPLIQKADRPHPPVPQPSVDWPGIRDDVSQTLFSGLVGAGIGAAGHVLGGTGAGLAAAALTGYAIGDGCLEENRWDDLGLLASVAGCLGVGAAFGASGIISSAIAGMALGAYGAYQMHQPDARM